MCIANASGCRENLAATRGEERPVKSRNPNLGGAASCFGQWLLYSICGFPLGGQVRIDRDDLSAKIGLNQLAWRATSFFAQ
jgi:hypothetical protein